MKKFINILLILSFMSSAYSAEPSVSTPELPKLPDFSKLPSLPNSSNNVITTPPAPPSLTPPISSKVEEKKAENKPIKDISIPKKKNKRKHQHKQSKKILANFRTEILPETIYKKHYDNYNYHLPIAYYQSDYDKLLFASAREDDLEGLRALINNGNNLNITNLEGDTPLITAIKNNSINATRLLLTHHANPNQSDAYGSSPLQIANAGGNYQIIRALEEMGAR